VALVKFGILQPKTVLIAPRGELGGGALSIKPLKKSLYLKLAKVTRYYDQVFWHASSEQEARVFVRQNETKLPKGPLTNTANESFETLRLVYIGRISEKKGLHDALVALRMANRAITFDVYGGFESREYQSRIVNLISKLPQNVDVRLKGPIPHNDVRSTFRGYHAFLFPTTHENFGHTIIESLSASCPVLVRDVTPFTEVIENGGGLILPETPSEWPVIFDKIAPTANVSLEAAATKAGSAYATWRNGTNAPSVFDQLAQHLTGSRVR